MYNNKLTNTKWMMCVVLRSMRVSSTTFFYNYNDI